LAADPHVPLAEIAGGNIRQAVPSTSRSRSCGDRARWAKIGSRWKALDAWGQVTSTRTVSARDDYDVTGCAELSFTPTARGDLTSVLVSADSTWTSPPSAEWKPNTSDTAAFDALVAKEIPDGSVAAAGVPRQCTAIPTRARFFHMRGGINYAVGTSNAGYVIARHDVAGWSVITRQRSRITPYGAICYRPVAVFDMNGDGAPEIILRESQGDSWGETILEQDAQGQWPETVSSPGGSTA